MAAQNILALIILGALAGTGASFVLRRYVRSNNDVVRNTLIGILGALVGTFLFELLGIRLPNVLQGHITVGDIIIAFIGAVIVILAADFLEKRRF